MIRARTMLIMLATIPLCAAQAVSDPVVEDIRVTAKRPGGAAIADAVAQWRQLCVAPMRRDRRFVSPSADTDWQALDPSDRRRFGIVDASVPAFGLVDAGRAHTLLVKFERLALPARLVEHRCTLVVSGGRDHARMVEDVGRVLGARGTQRHVGVDVGSPALAGWDQWLWSAMPARRSSAWRIVQGDGAARAGGTWIVVADRDLFYDRHDYVFADLKIRRSADRALTMLTLSHTGRPE